MAWNVPYGFTDGNKFPFDGSKEKIISREFLEGHVSHEGLNTANGFENIFNEESLMSR